MAMTVQSGVDVGRSLERAVDRVRRQLDDHVTGVNELDQQVHDLMSRRGGALLDLAQHYLPDISLETIQGAFVEIRDDLLEVVARKQRREREVQDQIAACERKVEQHEAELGRVTEALNAKASERQKLEELVAQRLHGSEEFNQLSQQALVAEQELERNEARVAEVKQEAEKKLPSYDRSRLFKYLYDAGYGTSRYQGQGLTRRLDAWVARMINFPSARRGYDFLRVTPELMGKEVARRRDRFNELMAQVEAIEDRVSDEVGLTAVMREGQQMGADRDRLVSVAARAQDDLLNRQQDLLKLTGQQNEFYEQALARMKNFLMNLPPKRLAAESRSTPSRQDDAIVAELTWIGDQLRESEKRGAALAHERQAWEDRLGGLQAVLQRFRQAEFDSRRSLFSAELDADELTGQFLAGRLGANEFWSILQRCQQFAPDWHEQPEFEVRFPAGNDMSYVLWHVLAEVAGAAMRHAAHRGMERRAPMRSQRRQSTGRPPFPNRGFTNGRGF